MRILLHILLVVCIGISSCSSPKKDNKPAEAQTKKTQENDYRKYIPILGNLSSYDQNRLLENETAFFIDSSLIAARLSPMLEANKAVFTAWDGTEYPIQGFVAIDRINDLVILKTAKNPSGGVKLLPEKLDSIHKVNYLVEPSNNVLSVRKGSITAIKNVKGSLRYLSTYSMHPKTYGSPILYKDACIGLGYADIVDYEKQGLVIPSTVILNTLKQQTAEVKDLSQLRSRNDQATSIANSKIRGLVIETDMGDITIRLFNETPIYRDNFIALVREHYYDGLLIHRVIPNFCIQSGAADTRYAGKDDMVGWKGPGYTLPSHIIKGMYHKRGMIGSPKLPERSNKEKRSNGSQFYIVTGRRYTDKELDEISKENNYQFTAEQRHRYKTIGGAPHVDGSFTIFGEVISGLSIADKINNVAINPDYRPIDDIRIKQIRILE